MFGKFILRTGVFVGALVVPALLFTGYDWWSKLRGQPSTPAAAAANIPASAAASPEAVAAGAAASRPLPLEGARVAQFDEIFRFDISPDWIVRRWPRVTTGLAHLELQGYRVSVVTGTDVNDLAGSLTYYFNAQQQVQRITFSGWSGDIRRLVDLLTSRYRFARRLTNDPSVILFESAEPGNKVTSVLRVRSASIIKASEPLKRFEIELVMERPSE